jgi:hypothetical protein
VLPNRRIAFTLATTLLLTAGAVPFATAAEPVAPEVVSDALTLDQVAAEEVAAEDRADLPELLEEVRAAEVELGLAGDEDDADAPGRRTEVIEAPMAFTSLWAELPEGLDTVAVRTSADGVDWTDWAELGLLDAEDAPDAGTAEAATAVDAVAVRITDQFFAHDARFLQLESDADAPVGDVTVGFIDTDGLNESVVSRVARHLTPRGQAPAEASTVPSWVNSRAVWGAEDYRGTPSVARNGVRQVVVHHTAGQNNLDTCNRAQIISTIKNIQHYHRNTLGWSDIGYNVVIDPCGGVWEGRAGGLDRAVIGAHAAGYNTGSTGVSVLGNFSLVQPNARILEALDRVVAWKSGVHGMDPTGSVTIDGRSLPVVVGHRDVGNTACPGSIQSQLWRVRTNAAAGASNYPRVPDGLDASSFSDTTGSPHEQAIEDLVRGGVTQGFADGTFRPLTTVRRGQVATFLANALDITPTGGSSLSDVAGSPHERAIYALVQRGVLSGYPDGSFRPQEPLRREHMAVILTRALDLAPEPAAAERFSDVTAYRGEVGAIVAAGITNGRTERTFAPRADVTRGQMATFLVNGLRTLG